MIKKMCVYYMGWCVAGNTSVPFSDPAVEISTRKLLIRYFDSLSTLYKLHRRTTRVEGSAHGVRRRCFMAAEVSHPLLDSARPHDPALNRSIKYG